MRTVQEVYDLAIHLLDEQHEYSGATDTADTREYRLRAPRLLTTLLNEVYPYSDTWTPPENGRRSVHPPVTALDSALEMDDYICLSVLPPGLAALLIFDEDKDRYNAFWGDYLARLRQACETFSASTGFEAIEYPYGALIEHGEYARW